MLKQLFLAPTASGKTDFTIQIAREMAVSGKEVRVCVPTALQASALRTLIAKNGGALGVHILTFDRLVASCLNEAGETYTQLSEPVQYRLLRTLINQLPLEHYAPLKAKPGFIQVAGQLINELKSAQVDPGAFTTAVTGLGNEPRLRELADIYTAYQKQLQAQNWADRVGLHWLAVEALSQRAPDACRGWPLLIINGFDDFTPIQLTLLQLLADRVGQFTVTLPKAAHVSFPRYQRTRQEIEASLDIQGEPLPPTNTITKRRSSLQQLANQLFTRTDKTTIPDEGTLFLREAPDRAAEVRTALRWIKQQIVWGGAEPDTVALLARDITPYRPFISQIAAEFGLPIRLIDGQPLAYSPAITTIMTLLRLYLPTSNDQANLSRRPLIATWRSPYFHFPTGDTPITSAAADTLDLLARQQRVIGGIDQWRAAFSAASSATVELQNDEEEAGGGHLLDHTTVSQLYAQFNDFLHLTQPPTSATMRGFVQWLETLIGPDPEAPGETPILPDSLQIVSQARANPTTATADVAALQTLKEILRGLVWAEEAVGQSRPVDFPTFFNELSGAIAAQTLTLPTRPGQPEIVVADATQVRGLRFAAVALMGLSEGSFPATISEDPFLRDADRQALNVQFGFPLEPSTQSAEREFFYEAISRARQRLLLTRPVLADNGADWVASPFWEAVRQLVTVEPETIPSQAVVSLPETASPAEWWESVAAGTQAAPQSGDPTIWSHIQDAAHIWQVREEEPDIFNGDLTTLAPDLATRFGPSHIWSASRLESYQTCPFFFFTKSVLNLEPRPEPAEGLDVAQLGTLYHNIFEDVMGTGLPDPVTEAAVADHVIAIATPILDAAPTEQGFRETGWWAQTCQEILDNVIRSVLALTDGPYTFLKAEASFGFRGDPLVISDGDDRLQLHGFIDRIDQRPDGQIRLIDYKLGGKYGFPAKAFAQGKKLQLPLYALAAQETLGLGEVANGFYWHFQQAESSPFQLEKAAGGVGGAMDTAVMHAWDAVHRIRDGSFAPQPPAGGCPAYCPAAAYCWQYEPKSW